MTVTGFAGPIVQYGLTLSSSGGDGINGQDFEHNPNRGPMIADLGDSMMDPRAAYNYDPGHTSGMVGFYNNYGSVDYVPTTLNSSAFVATATGSSGVSTFVLAAASSAGGTYATTIIAPETGKATGTLIAIDSTAAFLNFGVYNTQIATAVAPVRMWNPAAGTGRNIVIKPSSNLDAGTFSVAGRDMYGYKITETIAGGSTSLAGKKAFKYVSSITNTTTPTSTGVSIGFGDIYGFPLAVPYTGFNADVNLLATSFSSAAIVALSSANTVLASTVSVQTSTTPDVRGTYASTTASNGTLRVQMLVTPPAASIAAITSTNVSPLFGFTQFSSV